MNHAAHILAATDLSAPARHAVERAGRLAALADSELDILCVLELGALDALRHFLGVKLLSAKADIEADARERLAQLVADVALQHRITAKAQVISGIPLTVVAHEAAALDASLVVLGAHGESFLRHAMLGSTAERLLRKSGQRPVLIVKQAPRENYHTILIAVDFSPVSLQLIQTARRWARGADLVLLHVFELPYEGLLWRAGIEQQEITRLINADIEKRRKQLHDLAAQAGLTPPGYSARVVHGDPSQQIVAMEQEYDADLIVAGKHGTHMTEDLLLGSVTKHVLAESQGDVLVVADPRPGADKLA